MSVFVVRAFIRLREVARTHGDLAAKLDLLERRVSDHDGSNKDLLRAIRVLLEPPAQPRKRIGFRAGDPDGGEDSTWAERREPLAGGLVPQPLDLWTTGSSRSSLKRSAKC